jgi:hypothetical protein
MGTCRSVSQRAGNVVRSSFFSGVVTLSNSVMASERLLCANHVRCIWSRTKRGLSMGSMWCVGQVSPAGCTSIRITATLRYE